MNYLISGKGFFKESSFNSESKSVEYQWCDSIIDAKQFSKSSGAKTLSQKLLEVGIQSFVWHISKEIPIRDKYIVKKRNNNEFITQETHSVDDYIVCKITMSNHSDQKFIRNDFKTCKEQLLDLDQAIELRDKLNKEMLDELSDKITGKKDEIHRTWIP